MLRWTHKFHSHPEEHSSLGLLVTIRAWKCARQFHFNGDLIIDLGNPKCSSAMRACVNCQKRKSRCLRGSAGGEGPCSYCSRTSKTCSFETPPDRTPLTRKNLNAAERRCAQLRSLLSSLNPDLDIDSALDRLSSDRGDAHWQAPQETDESTPGSYEWHEGSLSPESKSTAQDDMLANDGMATLSTEDAGYLGVSR